MSLFSQRKGLKPIKETFQSDSMDDELRNSLWNAFYLFFWKANSLPEVTGSRSINSNYKVLTKRIWLQYFKQPIDSEDTDTRNSFVNLKDYFMACAWFEAYDFIEFAAKAYPDPALVTTFRSYCNSVLEKELSAYRFVGEDITAITSGLEINEIELGLQSTSPINAINTHLKRALELISDKQNPDYRNSIKESISAVEAICKLITGNTNTTLGAALNEIEKNNTIPLHQNLKDAFKQLYWYTSDAAGIRHAIKDSSSVSFEDAKFMLVTCTSFVNYLLVLAGKSGITL